MTYADVSGALRLARGSNPDYWIPKIQANMVRDRSHDQELASSASLCGWIFTSRCCSVS